MQLAGSGVYGPPADRAAVIAVVRRAVELEVNHIDTSDYYGPQDDDNTARRCLGASRRYARV